MRDLTKTRQSGALHVGLMSGASALILALYCGPVAAQDAGMPPQEQEASTLDEIVVTAQKRSENLQDVPIAVTAFTAESLAARGLTNVSQIGSYIPNVDITGTSPFSGSTQVLSAFVRGIGQNDFAFNLDPGVGVYVDGVYYARTIGAVVDLLDLERIEVLKGPQGTLFGRNAIGGAINVVTRRPAEEFGGTLEYTIGEFNRADVRGAVDIPIIEDVLLAQVAFSSKSRDGYHEYLDFPGQYVTDVGSFIRPFDTTYDQAGGENSTTVRGKLEWRASDSVRLTVAADFQNVDEQPTPSQLVAVPGGLLDPYNLCISTPAAAFATDPGLAPFQALCTTSRATVGGALAGANVDGNPNNDRLVFDERFIPTRIDTSFSTGAGYSKIETGGLSAVLDWDLSDDLTLKSTTAYRTLDSAFALDVEGTPIPMGDHAFTMDQEQISQELQLTGTSFDGALEWVAGLYYFQEEGNLTDYVHFAGGLLQILGPNDFETTAYAAYTHLNYSLTERLSLTLGGRVTREEKSFTGAQRDLNSLAFLLGFPRALHPDPTDTTLYFPRGENNRDFENVSLKAGAEFDISDDILTYASYSQGFKSGGWTTRATVPILAAPEFDEETADTYEVGLKGQFLDRRLQTNLAVFFTKYNDLQVTVYSGISPVTENAAQSEIKGAELEVTGLVGENFVFTGSVGYTDAQYTELEPGANLQTDFLFLNTPEWSVAFAGDYTLPLENGATLLLHADYAYKSEIARDALNVAELISEPSNLVGALVAYRPADERWQIALGGKNLTDDRTIVTGQNQAGIGYIAATYSRPREWYLTLTANF